MYSTFVISSLAFNAGTSFLNFVYSFLNSVFLTFALFSSSISSCSTDEEALRFKSFVELRGFNRSKPAFSSDVPSYNII